MPDELADGGRGAGFWSAVASEHLLRPDEAELLTEAAHLIDLADRLRQVVADDGVMSTGSTGQPVVHPALVELRQVRGELRHHLRQLDLPDPEVERGDGKLRAV